MKLRRGNLLTNAIISDGLFTKLNNPAELFDYANSLLSETFYVFLEIATSLTALAMT